MAQTFLFNVSITCGACVNSIERALSEKDEELGTITHSCNLLDQTMSVTVENDALDRQYISSKIKNMIEDVGIDCDEIIDDQRSKEATLIKINQPDSLTRAEPETAPNATPKAKSSKKRKLISHIIKGTIGVLAGAGMIALMLSGVALPMAAMYAVTGVSSLLTLALGAESYWNTAKYLKSGTLTMDSLFTVSSLAIVAVSIASLFVPGLPMMCDAGLWIFGFREWGRFIEESMKQKISAQIKFADRGAKKVSRRNPVNHEDWPKEETENIVVGDIIRVYAGETIPLDGIYEKLENPEDKDAKPITVYQDLISGAEEPVPLHDGDNIYAGMVVPADVEFIQIRVSKTKFDSSLCRSDRESANMTAAAPIVKFANRMMQFFVPAIFLVAAVAGIATGFVLGLGVAMQVIASVLVSACPCTFGLISPLAIQMGVSKAKAHGVHFKDGEALESADKIDHVVFDINGTLTMNKHKVMSHVFLDRSESEDTLLAIAEEMESHTSHKIAQAIVTYSKQKKSRARNIALTDIDQRNHSGIKARHGNDEYAIGNEQFLIDNHIEDIPEIQLAPDDISQIIYMVKNGKVVGYFKVEDPLRKDAQFVIDELKLMGKEIHLCTGTSFAAAKQIGRKLGIKEENIFANSVGIPIDDNPRTKASYIESLKAQNKRVAMIGNAENDALAIKASHFGIVVKSASSDAMVEQYAGASIDKSSLLPVVTAFATAKETINSIKQNLIISLTYNMAIILVAGGILIGLGFALNPAIGVALMVVQAVLIILNQYRIYRKQFDHIKRYEAEMKLSNEQESTSTTRLLHEKGLTINPEKTLENTTQSEQQPPSPRHEDGSLHSPTLDAQPQASASLHHEEPRIFQQVSSGNQPF